jgi:DNA-directed RNA polymerase specialized sigma subunit
MLNYQNKVLYAKLKHLTLLIGHAIVTNDTKKYKLYIESKEYIKNLINKNLDELELTWNVTVKEQPIEIYDNKIMNYFHKNPDLNLKTIAKHFDTSQFRVSRIVSEYLRK